MPLEDLIRLICNETLKEKPEKAIDCFQVNVTHYPLSYNAHNALAKIYAIDVKIILLGQGFKKMSFGDCRFGSRSQKHFLEAYSEWLFFVLMDDPYGLLFIGSIGIGAGLEFSSGGSGGVSGGF